MSYNRLFTFGCSFTSWHWPTWADIMGQEFGEDRYYNLGICASGNEFAFHRLTEAHARYNITPDDLVVICWTNFAREDRWMHGLWRTAGNVFSNSVYPPEWVEKWFDLKGALIKTSSFIAGTTELLNNIGCDYVFGSAFPMTQIDQHDNLFTGQEYQPIFDVYQSYYDQIQPSMVQYLYGNSVWKNPEPIQIVFDIDDTKPWPDHHPSTAQHLRYATDILIPKLSREFSLSDQTLQWANDWQAKLKQDRYFNCPRDGWSLAHRWTKNHVNRGLL
jgi:hypothetical protein